MEVRKLPGQDHELMLVLTRQAGDEEAVFRMGGAQGLQGIQVRQSDAVAGHAQAGVHGSFHAHHEGKGLSLFPAMRQHGSFDESGDVGVGRPGKGRGQGHHAVAAVDASGPVGQETADFAEGLGAEFAGYVLSLIHI
jgi:hypothetical protein